ncbi:MAG: hypothetical protein FWB91_05450 [Defluviitaleaceae bacterium]|nr:hypothetical protein [Defluviitaleaceae bacterium]
MLHAILLVSLAPFVVAFTEITFADIGFTLLAFQLNPIAIILIFVVAIHFLTDFANAFEYSDEVPL